MTENDVKAIMAAILMLDLDKESFLEAKTCVFDAAADMAEQLYGHVVNGHPESEIDADDDSWGSKH